MTAQNLYNKFLKKEISKEKFLYEVRKQSHLPITKFNSFQDTIQILKTRGLISEEISKYKTDKNVFFPKQDIKTIDQVSPHEYAKGINYEMDLFDKSVGQNMPKDEELAKVQEKVLKNLTSDEYYYTRKMMSDEQKKVEKSDLECEELGKDTKAKNQMEKGKMLKENLDQHYSQDDEDLDMDLSQPEGCESCDRDKPELEYKDLWKLVRKADNIDEKKVEDILYSYGFPSLFMTDDKEKIVWWEELDNNEKNGLIGELEQMFNINESELDMDVMDPNELERLSRIIEEWGLTEYDLEDSDVIEELADEFQRRSGELEEGIALKDKAGNITYAKDDAEANQKMNDARAKNIQLTKQNV